VVEHLRQKRTIEAEEFVLRDPSGKIGAVIGFARGGGPAINLFDANGSPRVAIFVDPEGKPVLAFPGADRTDQVVLSVDSTGPDLALFDSRGQRRIALRVLPEGPGLVFYDDRGKTRILVVAARERTTMMILGDDEMSSVQLTNEARGSVLAFGDGNGQRRAVLEVSGQGGARFGLLDAKGNPLFFQP
jgi:hypothetical protein